MRIIVLGGGSDQIALIKELKNRGHLVYLVDYLDNPPAKKFADHFFQISTLDEDSIYELALKHGIELITTACTDQALLTMANVSEKLNLPCYLNAKTAKNVTDKAYMKKKMEENGIPTSKSVVLEINKYNGSIRGICFPLVVKPCDCNSSKGVTRVENSLELKQAIQKAYELSRSKRVIIEEYKAGREISIDAWSDSQGVKILAVTETIKMEENDNRFTIYQSKYPFSRSDELELTIRNTVEKICKVFQLNNCPLLVQAIVQGDNLSVIEFSARMGGGSKYKFIEHMSGINIMKVYVNRILGEKTQIVQPQSSKKVMELDYVYAYNGKVHSLVGFDELKKNGEIQELFLYKSLNSNIDKRITSSDRILGFLIENETYDQVKKTREEIIAHVDILDNEGNSIMYKKCFEL